MTTEEIFNNTKRFCPKSKSIKRTIESFLSDSRIPLEEIEYYYLLTFKTEFFVVKKDKSIYKSFLNKKNAVDYCLDKINTESKQSELF